MKTTINNYKILVINPGSTSTKIALYNNTIEKYSKTIQHTRKELDSYKSIIAQKEFRLSHIKHFIGEFKIKSFDAIVCRGGLLRPVPSGIYLISKKMLNDLKTEKYGAHASNLGAILGYTLSQEYSCKAYIADPVIVDEMIPITRISGMPSIKRKSIFHALNQKAAARSVSKILGKPYSKCKFIVAHCGGGISVGAHLNGKVIDVNNALDGDGPFSPERSGGLPVGSISNVAYHYKRPFNSFRKNIVGNAGLSAYCHTNDLLEIFDKINKGDETAKLIYSAMILQISKEIAQHGATFKGNIDSIIITGGMAKSRKFIQDLKKRISYLSAIHVIPGEKEMEALVFYTIELLQNRRKVQKY